MKSRIDLIRDEEKRYHDYCYENYSLFEEGSWLYKPVKTVMNNLNLFNHLDINVLDLGCGVGRNSIPIAEKLKNSKGKVVCVDILDTAINKLLQYSKKYNMLEIIEAHRNEISDFSIIQDMYDYIIAVSAIEHVQSELVFQQVLRSMAFGTKTNGINCIIMNTNIHELDLETNEQLEPYIELNFDTNNAISLLRNNYSGWDELSLTVNRQEYKIKRNERQILLTSDVVTIVARKM
jgi:2-polyprenyl-3-methyl-5-hydroxy-6-metoxy-1,4-benzoquinol methylase